jgi:hypothetical protein
MSKLDDLFEVEGLDDLADYLDQYGDESVIPGICTNDGCNQVEFVEPDCHDGFCSECNTNTIKSGHVLLGIIMKALEESIEHWKDNVALAKSGKLIGISPRFCALCLLFLNGRCVGCPVFKRTGQLYCRGTPYDKAAFLREYLFQGKESDRRGLIQACEEEVAFLESLREV